MKDEVTTDIAVIGSGGQASGLASMTKIISRPLATLFEPQRRRGETRLSHTEFTEKCRNFCVLPGMVERTIPGKPRSLQDASLRLRRKGVNVPK